MYLRTTIAFLVLGWWFNEKVADLPASMSLRKRQRDVLQSDLSLDGAFLFYFVSVKVVFFRWLFVARVKAEAAEKARVEAEAAEKARLEAEAAGNP